VEGFLLVAVPQRHPPASAGHHSVQILRVIDKLIGYATLNPAVGRPFRRPLRSRRSTRVSAPHLFVEGLQTVDDLHGARIIVDDPQDTFDQPGARKVESWDLTDVSIRIYGDIGLVVGLAEVTDILNGDRRHIRFRYTHVWVKRNGNWQLVHRPTTRVATIEGPAPPC